MITLINLIGEQPIPNLLPILYLKPAKTIILSTPTTENIAKRIQKLTDNCTKIIVEPYDIQEFKDTVNKLINQNEEYVFNITGGTKIMSVALYEIAIEKKADIIYLQSEGKKSLLYIYKIDSNGIIHKGQKELPELINMDQYLHAHLPEYEINLDNQKSSDRGFVYERTITNLLKTNNFEIACSVKPKGEGNQLEIDAVLRLKGTNNFGIAEIKIGDRNEEGPKKGIDQLALAGQREYLGTYTNRFLITQSILSKQIKELARAHHITVIDEIVQNRNDINLTESSKLKLIQRIKEKLT
jgi:hypothetical protein